MKVKSLEVKGLYNRYDYVVNFNDDITFLYGDNGSGKTTILTLLSAIVGGEFEKLFEYTYQEIYLTYIDNQDKVNQIAVVTLERNINTSNDGNITKVSFRGLGVERELNKEQEGEIRVLGLNLKKVFNCVDLPLYRQFKYSAGLGRINREARRISGMTEALQDVEGMIRNRHIQIMNHINEVNEDFKMNIISNLCSFDIDFTHTSDRMSKKQDITKSKNKLMAAFRELDILNGEQSQKIEDFYKKIEEYSSVKTKDPFVAGYLDHSLKQMNRIVELLDELEDNKKRILTPIRQFEETIQEFFEESKNAQDKRIRILNDGRIKVFIDNQVLPLRVLSSGERQLIIFFANLIFNMETDDEGVFIADEPELSLHLEWQKRFVKTMIKVNPRIQIIFATHSPELVNIYTSKMSELIPYRREKEICNDNYKDKNEKTFSFDPFVFDDDDDLPF